MSPARALRTPPLTTVLRGERVLLRAPHDDDVSRVCRAWRRNAERLSAYLHAPEATLTRTATWIASERDAWQAGARFAFLLFDSHEPNAELRGQVNVTDVLGAPRHAASLGMWVDRTAEGRGIAHEALTCVLSFAFESLGLHRVEAAVAPSNLRSQKLLERLGFHGEGLARSYLPLDGTWADHLLFARLEDD